MRKTALQILLTNLNRLKPKNHNQEVVLSAIKCVINETDFSQEGDSKVMTLVDIEKQFIINAYNAGKVNGKLLTAEQYFKSLNKKQ